MYKVSNLAFGVAKYVEKFQIVTYALFNQRMSSIKYS